MKAKLTDRKAHPSDCTATHPVDGYEEQIATEILERLATDWSLLQKPGALVPETDGWFPPSRPRRGCDDC
jgi:hypothetical protein